VRLTHKLEETHPEVERHTHTQKDGLAERDTQTRNKFTKI